MRGLVSFIFVAALLGLAGPVSAQKISYEGWQKGPWAKYNQEDGLTVFLNDSVPTGVDAIRVDAILDFPAHDLFPIITSEERARSYSFIREFKVIANYANKWGYLYQRVKSNGIDDRDFTVKLRIVIPKDVNGGPYGWKWKQANEKGPKPKDGVVRASVVSGSYLLTPIDGGKRTLVSYRLWFDPTTWVPDFLVNPALRNGAIETVKRLEIDAKKKLGKKK